MPFLSRLSAALLLVSGAALAQEPTLGPAAKTPPTGASSPPAICTDRPSKATSACTVPKGSFQLETDLINWTWLRDVVPSPLPTTVVILVADEPRRYFRLLVTP